jgi:hypothetical protein
MYKVTLLSIFLLSAAFGTVQFKQVEAYTGGEPVSSAQAADYNGDGLKDIIFSVDRGIYISLTPDYALHQIRSMPKPLKVRCVHSTLMDVDGDGDLDFLGTNNGVFWLECPDNPITDQPWKIHWITQDFTGLHCITVQDIDEDGRDDIVFNNFFPAGHKIEQRFPNRFPASIVWFRVPETPHNSEAWKPIVLADGDAPGGSHYIAFADLDADGHDELLLGAKGEPFENGNYFAYWTRTDDVEAPWKRTTLTGEHTGATHLYGADLNGDGLTDLIGSLGHGKGITQFIAPEFKPSRIDEELEAPHAFRIADIEGDGDIDLFVCARLSKRAEWYENDGEGNFTRHLLSDNQEAYDIVITDLDSDEDLDLVIAGLGSGNIALFMQQ